MPFAAAALLGTAGTAAAQAEPPPPSTATLPGFFPMMGPDGSGTSINAQLAFLRGEGYETTPMRLDLQAQFVAPSGGGAYATIAATRFMDTNRLGSLEVGGVWNRVGETGAIVVRGGLVLPTSRESDDQFEAFDHLILTALSRPADMLAAVPSTTTFRVAFSPSMRSNHFVLRADVGLDVPLDAPEGVSDAPYVHIDVGGGYDNGRLAAVVEASSMIYTKEPGEPINVIGATAQYHARTATPYLTISRPFGDGFTDGTPTFTNIILGVRGRL